LKEVCERLSPIYIEAFKNGNKNPVRKRWSFKRMVTPNIYRGYSPIRQLADCTIGAGGLIFSVRNGKKEPRCNSPPALTGI